LIHAVHTLPIDPLLPEAVACLTTGSRLVIRAAPGAGKTTRVPAALLDAGLAAGRQVVVLEPRRIAARAAAEFVAHERGGAVGGEVGYRVRFEQRGDAVTRLWFVTEGVLGRQLTHDPFLEQVGIVVLDEFHERHLQGDVALAVVRELQETVRPDLKLVVMSATLETDRLAAYLDDCRVLTSEGRAFPVQVEYESEEWPLAGRIVAAVRRVLAQRDDGGDILVFLPGAAEIRRTAAALESLAAEYRLSVVPLHGDLPLDAQQRAIRPAERRKVVLSTNVAETALTIEGVTVVIDSGLARIARFDAKHGINALRVAPISRAAADQRAGRAGRTAPGRCLRLWAHAEHLHRLERDVPEVLRLDLSGTLLDLRAWGLRDVRRFAWLDPPGEGAIQRAERLLQQLGAMDVASGSLTEIGMRMLDLSVSPRLARILVEAERSGCAASGALLAALASERDICVEQRALAGESARRIERPPAGSSDVLLRMQLFAEAARAQFDGRACHRLGLDQRSVRAVERARRQLQRALGCGDRLTVHPDDDVMLRCTLAGYPDRVVRRRSPGSARGVSTRGVMVGGTGVVLMDSSIVREAELFVAIEVDAGRRGQGSEARVRVASAVRPEWIAAMFPSSMMRQCEYVFDAERERVVERIRESFGDLVLCERIRIDVDPQRAGTVLAAAARRDPVRAARLGEVEQAWLQRLQFLQRSMPDLGWPRDADALLAEAVSSLCAGRCSFAEVRRADLLSVLSGLLTHQQRVALECEAPASYDLPSGRATRVTYAAGKPPAVAARIQELFGLTATPRLGGGRVPLVIELLAPNHRPVQITDDLESFWRTTYPEVRKQLRGRYPKHAWPEDPFTATPTASTRRRG
jgi:ATP-dependent helicase HrpB